MAPSRSTRARSTRRCSGSRRTGSSPASGGRPTTTAGRATTASPPPAGARSATSSRTGAASPPVSRRCCAAPEAARGGTAAAPPAPEHAMRWLHAARARARLLFARRAAESRMDEEIRFHLEMETARLAREERLAPEEARRRALVAFGGVERHREEMRDGRGLAWLGGLALDLRLGLRMLAKYPGLTLVGVLGMAVAVAIGAVSFGILYSLIGTTLPLDEGERIVAIQNIDARASVEGDATHLHDLAVWREALPAVGELGAYRTVDRNLITPEGPSEPVRVAEMTASGFRIARVPPLLGRYFNDEDERRGAPPVVVIGHGVWQGRFAGAPDVVG